MQLSIVIVNWNTRKILRDCLESVFANLGDLRAEVFVVDNGSTDGSPEMVAKEFPCARLIRNAENRGFAAANNQAIDQASGEYVLLLNSDTLVLGDVLQQSVEYLDRHAEVGVFGCRVLNADRSVQLTCSRYPSLVNLLLLTSGLYRCRRPAWLGRYQILDWQRDTVRDVETVTGCYMMVRSAAIREVGPLDEDFFFYGEETDWCRRFADADWQLRFAPVGEIIHYGSLSSRKCNHRRDVMLTRGLIQLHRKHGGRFAALATWLLLASFNASRSAYWSIRSLFSRRPETAQRRDHFLRVTRDFGALWSVCWGAAS
jgi:GT2 family glycosyltransferase